MRQQVITPGKRLHVLLDQFSIYAHGPPELLALQLGFYLHFLKRPCSIEMRWKWSVLSLTRAWNPGAGSMRTTAKVWALCRTEQQQCEGFPFLSSMICAVVYEDAHSRIIKMSWFSWFITSAANVLPTVSGGSDVDCSMTNCGTNLLECRTLWACWSDAVYGLVHIQCIEKPFIGLALGCESWRWMAVSSPWSTDLGMMISSLEGTNRSFRFTTSSPSIAIVSTLR